MYTFFRYVQQIFLENVGLWTFFTKQIGSRFVAWGPQGSGLREQTAFFGSCFTRRETCTEKSARFTKGMFML